jgi:hypothetical protein
MLTAVLGAAYWSMILAEEESEICQEGRLRFECYYQITLWDFKTNQSTAHSEVTWTSEETRGS